MQYKQNIFVFVTLGLLTTALCLITLKSWTSLNTDKVVQGKATAPNYLENLNRIEKRVSNIKLNENNAILKDKLEKIQLSLSKFAVKDTRNMFKEQRNELSKIAQTIRQRLGQLECELNKGRMDSGKTISQSGGWCEKESRNDGGKHMFDKPFADYLVQIFEKQNVGSFGDGPGMYKKYMAENGRLLGYDAYDGAPFVEKATDKRVNYLDFTLPIYGLPVYDWIMSLEVAEHIPKEYEHIYLDNICRHAKIGIILSWGVPGQGGFGHINLQTAEYVRSVLEKKGFEVDIELSKILKTKATLPWLRGNTFAYRRTKTAILNVNLA